MKRRTRLVSNSSSSSFMCTFGKVTDHEKFDLVDDDDFPRDVEMLSPAGEKQGFQRLDGCCYAGRNG